MPGRIPHEPNGPESDDLLDPEEAETLYQVKFQDSANGLEDPAPKALPGTRIGSITGHLHSLKNIAVDVALPSDDLPANVIAGTAPKQRYATLGEIARGGMGAIVKLVDNDIRRAVAMKVILGGEDRERVARFVEEAQVTGQLEHPNIVPVHELGMNDEGKVYFTMKLVKGESLEQILDRVADERRSGSFGGPSAQRYTLSHLLQVFLKICDAMAFAHSKGVIHRDLKPENVMVGPFGEVLVMDWGLGKVKGRHDGAREDLVATIRSDREVGRTLDGELMGTPSYMPPEQAEGEMDRIDERSDIFSLGGILYKILCLEPPYTGESVVNVLAKAVKGDVVPPRRRSPWLKIPAELESACMKAMAPEPGDRYDSVEEFAEDVRAHLDHRLVKAHRYGLWSRFSRWVQRHPTASVAGAVALVLVTAGAGLTGSMAARAREKDVEARLARAEAETQGLRAEREKERATVAEGNLAKGRTVSALLRRAESELGPVRRELERSFHSPKGIAARRETGERLWPDVEAFGRTVPSDRGIQAAWLAAKGWLRRLAGFEEEAFDLFRRSRELDPDVPYGPLFEGMVHLSLYLAKHPLPSITVTPKGVQFGEMPGETAELRGLRERFERALGEAERARVWGETASSDFRKVLDGFRAIQTVTRGTLESDGPPPEGEAAGKSREQGLKRAEEGLTSGLAVSEMAWFREEILHARAKVRYVLKHFDEGLADAEACLSVHPDRAELFYCEGHLYTGKGAFEASKGLDPGPLYRKAIEAFGQAARRSPGFSSAHHVRGILYMNLGDAETARGEDPRGSYAKAVEEIGEALRMNPELGSGFGQRGDAWRKIGEAEGERGEDPRGSYRRALADYEEELRRRPDNAGCHNNCGLAHVNLGKALEARGEDPRECFRRAIEAFGKTMSADRELTTACFNLGNACWYLGKAEGVRGEDPRPSYGRAIEAYREAIRRNLEDEKALGNLGIVLAELGAAQAARGEDPRPSLREAAEAYGEALRRNPEDAETHGCRGYALYLLGQAETARGEDPRPSLERAVEAFGEVLRRNPEHAKAYLSRGIAHQKIGEAAAARGEDPLESYRRAMEDYGETLKRNRDFWQAHANTGAVLEHLGRFEEAVAAYERALAIAKDDFPLLKEWLARAKKALNR